MRQRGHHSGAACSPWAATRSGICWVTRWCGGARRGAEARVAVVPVAGPDVLVGGVGWRGRHAGGGVDPQAGLVREVEVIEAGQRKHADCIQRNRRGHRRHPHSEHRQASQVHRHERHGAQPVDAIGAAVTGIDRVRVDSSGNGPRTTPQERIGSKRTHHRTDRRLSGCLRLLHEQPRLLMFETTLRARYGEGCSAVWT